MHGLKHIIVAFVVVSAFAVTGCSDVEMTADTSPGSETPENYDVDIKEPTNGTIFDDLYVYGLTGHQDTVTLKIRNSDSLGLIYINEIRYGDKEVIQPEARNQTYEYTGSGLGLTVPYKDGVTERRYRLEALNETGHVIDAVNVTITQTGSDSGWF